MSTEGFAAWHRVPEDGEWGHRIHSTPIGDPGATELPDDAVAEIAARMFDGDLSQQPQRVQDAVWRDARFALEAALKHIPSWSSVRPAECSLCDKPLIWGEQGWEHLDGSPSCFKARP